MDYTLIVYDSATAIYGLLGTFNDALPVTAFTLEVEKDNLLGLACVKLRPMESNLVAIVLQMFLDEAAYTSSIFGPFRYIRN